jgi:lipoprotein-anchoring transpeptidase ErfK/SrfK
VRRIPAVVAALAVTIAAAPAVCVAASPRAVPASQDVATLHSDHPVRNAPRAGASVRSIVSASRPITGVATVLPVTARRTSADGRRWLRVRLPGRPNSSQGWIAQAATTVSATAWQLVVRTATRRIHVYRRGRLVRILKAVVGKPATPTPRGSFFVEESIDLPSGAVGGPFALATSARSNVLQEFAGGPGQIGIHGVENLGGTPGTAVSHGCVRLANAGIRWLVARIQPGTPVTIVA